MQVRGQLIPQDVLNMITALLADEEIHSLSLVSKRLHLAVTPSLLRRYSIVHGGHMLSVVDMSHFRGLRFMCRALGFAPPSFMLILLPVDDAEAELCSRDLLDFFSSPIVRARPIQAVFLTLCGTSQPSQWKTVLEQIVAANVRELQVHQDDKSALIGNMKLRGALESFPLLRHHLKAFHAEAPFLFLPCILPWTRTFINTSRIKSLSLRCRLDRSPSWSNIIPHLTVPSLETLSLEGRVTMSSLSAFLVRHHGVQTLKIGAKSSHKITDFEPTALEPRQPYVFRLRELEAPVSYLVQLLGRATRGGTACSLNTLTILPDLTATGYPFAACVQHILHEVADAEGLSWLVIHVPREVGVCIVPWCKLTVPEDCPAPFSTISRLEVRPDGDQKDWCVFSDAFLVSVLCARMHGRAHPDRRIRCRTCWGSSPIWCGLK